MKTTQTKTLTTALRQSLFACSALLVMLLAQPATAGMMTVTGDTTGQPTFLRPSDNGDSPPTRTGATSSAYFATPFSVSSTGLYDLEVVLAGFDTYLILYENIFNPADSLVNALIADDDGGSGFYSAITDYQLMAGVQYFAVMAGYGGATGSYTLEISGPGEVSSSSVRTIPEPSTWLLFGLGIAAVGLGKRRRSAKAVR